MERESQSGKVCLHLHPSHEQSWTVHGPSSLLSVNTGSITAFWECHNCPGHSWSHTAPPGRTALSASVLQLCTLSLLMGVDVLTTLHLALKCPSFGLSVGTGSSLTQSLSTAVNRSAALVGRLRGFWQVYSCAHTKPLLPTHTCNGKRSALKSEASKWVAFTSFCPCKIKAIFFSERKKPNSLWFGREKCAFECSFQDLCWPGLWDHQVLIVCW